MVRPEGDRSYLPEVNRVLGKTREHRSQKEVTTKEKKWDVDGVSGDKTSKVSRGREDKKTFTSRCDQRNGGEGYGGG